MAVTDLEVFAGLPAVATAELEQNIGGGLVPDDPFMFCEWFYAAHEPLLGEQSVMLAQFGVSSEGAVVDMQTGQPTGVATLVLDSQRRDQGIYMWELTLAERATLERFTTQLFVTPLGCMAVGLEYYGQGTPRGGAQEVEVSILQTPVQAIAAGPLVEHTAKQMQLTRSKIAGEIETFKAEHAAGLAETGASYTPGRIGRALYEKLLKDKAQMLYRVGFSRMTPMELVGC